MTKYGTMTFTGFFTKSTVADGLWSSRLGVAMARRQCMQIEKKKKIE